MFEQLRHGLHPALVAPVGEQHLLGSLRRRARRPGLLARHGPGAGRRVLGRERRRRCQLGTYGGALLAALAQLVLVQPRRGDRFALAVGLALSLGREIGLARRRLPARLFVLLPGERLVAGAGRLRLVRRLDLRSRRLLLGLGSRKLGRGPLSYEGQLALQHLQQLDRRLDGVEVAGVLLLPALRYAGCRDGLRELAGLRRPAVHVLERLHGRLDPLVARGLPALVVGEVADEACPLHQRLPLLDALGQQLVRDRDGDLERGHA